MGAELPRVGILEFAAAIAGVVLVTVNPAFRTPEAEHVLKQSRSAGVVTATEFRGIPMLAMVEELQPRCRELREVIRFDQWQNFLASASGFDGELTEPEPSDPVMIQYTSGTTGFPKGALLHHRGLANNGAHTADRMGLSDGGVMIGVMPLFHTGGCVCTVLSAASKRATLVLAESFDPGLTLELFAAYKGTAMLGVPTMLVAMMEHPTFATTDLSAIEAVCSGGSLVPAPMVCRFEEQLNAPFTIVFGQTECSPVASMTQPSDTIEDKAGTIGPPMPGVEVKIVDPVTGDTVPVGTVGEYCTRGYHVMNGYFENPDATADAIDFGGWLHTGDLCAMDECGYCTVEGRLKDMIIRGGENIYPPRAGEPADRPPSRRRGGGGRVARREVGGDSRRLRPPHSRVQGRQGRALRIRPRGTRAAQARPSTGSPSSSSRLPAPGRSRSSSYTSNGRAATGWSCNRRRGRRRDGRIRAPRRQGRSGVMFCTARAQRGTRISGGPRRVSRAVKPTYCHRMSSGSRRRVTSMVSPTGRSTCTPSTYDATTVMGVVLSNSATS